MGHDHALLAAEDELLPVALSDLGIEGLRKGECDAWIGPQGGNCVVVGEDTGQERGRGPRRLGHPPQRNYLIISGGGEDK